MCAMMAAFSSENGLYFLKLTFIEL